MSRVVGSIPHAQPGAREFSLGGVLWKTVLYALTYVAAFACGWFLLFDQNQDWVRMWVGQGLLLAVLSGLAVVVLLGRYEDGKERPGPWFVVLSLPCAPGFGVISGSGARYSGGVFRWILVSVAVLVAAGVSVFPLVTRLVRNGFASWAAMVVLCVVPSWMLAKTTGSASVSLFWCCVVGVVGVVGVGLIVGPMVSDALEGLDPSAPSPTGIVILLLVVVVRLAIMCVPSRRRHPVVDNGSLGASRTGTAQYPGDPNGQ